jgi:hypothetical protein
MRSRRRRGEFPRRPSSFYLPGIETSAARSERSTVMTKGVVVIYISRLGGRLDTHQKVVLEADAKVIAHVLGYDVGARQPLRQ